MTLPRICITGFRPFPGVPVNPTALLVEALQGDAAWPSSVGVEARFRLLDTHYLDVREEIATLLDDAPDALVMLGFSSQATGITLETQATDHCLLGRPDASGYCPAPGAGALSVRRNAAVDFPALLAALHRADLPAGLSQDAGGYVCNHTYWCALNLIAERNLRTSAIFVHLPALEGMEDAPACAATMTLEAMRRGIGIVVRGLV